MLKTVLGMPQAVATLRHHRRNSYAVQGTPDHSRTITGPSVGRLPILASSSMTIGSPLQIDLDIFLSLSGLDSATQDQIVIDFRLAETAEPLILIDRYIGRAWLAFRNPLPNHLPLPQFQFKLKRLR
jgi:hypothetical protein